MCYVYISAVLPPSTVKMIVSCSLSLSLSLSPFGEW
jgi:hypothetical protein